MRFLARTRLTQLCCGLAAAFAAMATQAAAPDTTRVIVEFKPGGAAAASARAAIAQLGGRVKLELIGGDAVAVEVPKQMLAKLRAAGGVALVEEDAPRYPMAATSPSKRPYRAGQRVPYGIPMVQADKLPEADRYASNRMVCIIDSGLDREHADLGGNDLTGEFDSGTGWWYVDGAGHGTHVAGTIAAINNKGTGVVGVNPNRQLKLHIVKVFGDDGIWAYSSTLINAARKCQQAGANIISMSLGGAAPSSAEERQFGRLRDAGVLSIAAAGNAGNTSTSYPAGYAAVLSVAAIDENMARATFSQQNADVELAAPGVTVYSTVPTGTGLGGDIEVGTDAYFAIPMEGSAVDAVLAPMADFQLGAVVDPSVAGKVCLIARGEITFALKAQNCADSGGIGAIIYNNVPGDLLGTLGTYVSPVPVVGVSDADGALLVAQLGEKAGLRVATSDYGFLNGTSMATPHVSAVAALVWSYFPACSGEDIRSALDKSALDLGTPGRDIEYGYGLVQAQSAFKRLKDSGCKN